MTEPEIKHLTEKKLTGKNIVMSLSNNRTVELWKSFMPHRKEIGNAVSSELFSVQVYDSSLDFSTFSPTTTFKKWAAVEVANFDQVPDHMETFTLPGGLYAVFDYKGLNTDDSIFRYIFGTWLPNSDYDLDDRPHFEVLGDKYRNNDPMSEEEIWIPIKFKNSTTR